MIHRLWIVLLLGTCAHRVPPRPPDPRWPMWDSLYHHELGNRTQSQ